MRSRVSIRDPGMTHVYRLVSLQSRPLSACSPRAGLGEQMEHSSLTIAGVTARPVIAPLKRPVRTALGTIPAAPLVLIDVRTEEGVVGRSFLFGYTPVALAPLVELIESLGEEIKGQPVVPI